MLCVVQQLHPNQKFRPDAVAHTYNLSYSEDGDKEDHGSRVAWAKSQWDPISINKLDVVHIYNSH
jgi:hypothetical protein